MNILWITTDHQQWRTIAGRSPCRTPNLQRLVDGGMLFERSYTPMPVCCPVRAMWASGAYPWHNGVATQVHSAPSLTRDMFPDVATYSQRLKEAGYRLGFVGKWHASQLRTPRDFGFDELEFPRGCSAASLQRLGLRPPGSDFTNSQLRFTAVRTMQWPGSEPFPMWGYFTGPLRERGPARLADAAIGMLRRYAQDTQPWHIAVHFPEPHDPYVPHKEFLDQYDPARLPVPESFHDQFAGKPGLHRREADTWGRVTEADVRQGMAHFFAYCTEIDYHIGRILDALDNSGQAAQTLVAFTTDHGDMLGAHRMWIKSWMPYEEVYRVPLVVRLPGTVPAGSRTDHLVQTHDLPHTFLDLAGAAGLPYADGRSLRPLFADPQRRDWEDAILCASYGCEFFVTQRMVITPRYKAVFNGFDEDELYDLRRDPHELRNLNGDPEHAAVRGQLRRKLYELMNRFGDPYGDNSAVPNGEPANRYGGPRYWARE